MLSGILLMLCCAVKECCLSVRNLDRRGILYTITLLKDSVKFSPARIDVEDGIDRRSDGWLVLDVIKSDRGTRWWC